MTASGTVNVGGFVCFAGMLRRADVGIPLANLNGMLVDVVAVHAVKVPFMNVVHMVPVPDRFMTAAGSMNVSMRFVNGMFVVHRLDTTSLPEPAL